MRKLIETCSILRKMVVLLSGSCFGKLRHLNEYDLSYGYTWARSYVDSSSKWNPPNSMHRLSSWSPLEMGWIKLNYDEAMSLCGQHASIGGVLRDSNANRLCGYVTSFGRGFNSSLLELRLLH
ncbi:hypothetical protein PVK06_009365 [Gossypium arboreum]|uniref:Uncharacterized protein n=1 Tax=Gossypium arboreum TaxID=29729 RepID=A0ABR0QML5_GOSAR|nr:hypothetical protein PVK06_009365 [Gossypium arboreum]